MDTISAQSHDHIRQTIIDGITSSEASIRALKSRYNELAPISRLPPETLATIFTFLPAIAWYENAVHLKWIRVAHVCRRWRETALNYPRFWSHINLTKLTPNGIAEVLARAKMAPLHLEADFSTWKTARIEALERQLEAHISHIRHLGITGSLGISTFERLSSSAPTLESLSLLHISPVRYRPSPTVIPDNLFNCTVPNLTSLHLENCDITWKSPLFKGLRFLRIDLSAKARPELNDWLHVLEEMPQLEELHLEDATPLASLAHPHIRRTVTLPSLIYFYIRASAKDCALALSHLELPTLTQLGVDVVSHDQEGEDVLLLIPYVVRNVYEPQNIEPIRSVLIASERKVTNVLTWTTPGADIKVCNRDTLDDMSLSARLSFTAHHCNGMDTAIFDAFFTLLPMNFVSTLTAQNRTRLSKKSWLGYASRLPLLEQVRLVPTAVRAFRDMLAEDPPPDGPRLPLLTRFVLLNVMLTARRTYHLRDMLIGRVEQGAPLEVLDLRTCYSAVRAIQLLAEVVVDVQKPLKAPLVTKEFSGHVGIGYWDEVEYDDVRTLWYGSGTMDDLSDEDEDEDEEDDEDDDSDSDYMI